MHRPQVIAANKTDCIFGEDDPVARLKAEFEPKGVKVFPISAVTGEGLKELLYFVQQTLKECPPKVKVFEQEFDPEVEYIIEEGGYTVEEIDGEFVVEGPQIEKMLGYTNLETEKGFNFFQKFLKDNGILEELEKRGIQDGDTVRLYGLSFDYYKS
jgi:GTP-binding protein